MTSAVVNILVFLAQSVVGIAIVTGHADYRAMAWVWIFSGAIFLASVLALGLVHLFDGPRDVE